MGYLPEEEISYKESTARAAAAAAASRSSTQVGYSKKVNYFACTVALLVRQHSSIIYLLSVLFSLFFIFYYFPE